MRIAFNAGFALQRQIAWLLVFSFCSLAFIGWLIHSNKKNVENTTFWINHTYSVITQIDKIKVRISDWDRVSGETPKPAYFTSLRRDIASLIEMTTDNPDQQALAVSLSGALDSLRPATDANTRTILKNTLRTMMADEKGLLSQRQTVTRIADKKSTLLLISGSLLAFLFIFIILLRLNRDIVLRKEAEQRLPENQSWLQAILDNTTSLIYIKDPEGRYIMVNRRFQEVIGVKDEDLIGKTDHAIATQEAADHYKTRTNT
ncbi:PAS domain S-box protein [Puia sp. P3]|uniref:PAS domain S-box protein n=1 Tax=Puia sp. P3 TaxID=3423952 RepID=UPI003D675082